MDFTALKTAIQNAVKLNGNEEITGDILQGVLLSMVTTLGDGAINDLVTAISNEATARQNGESTLNGYITALQGAVNSINTAIENGFVYAGIATPTTTPATGKVFYIALTAGTYTNFGNTEVSQGINILKYNGSTWSLDAVIALDDAPTPSSTNLVKSGGVFDKVMTDGSAFDISAHFASGGTLATYADLSAALTALNTLSASYKKGGMSIKFVQCSDNKYVQYRLMTDSFSTTVANWQGVDDNPTIGSNNLVKSGGIVRYVATHSLIYNYTSGVKFNGATVLEDNEWGISDYIAVQDGDYVEVNWGGVDSQGGVSNTLEYNSSKEVVNGITYDAETNIKSFDIHTPTSTIIVPFTIANISNVYVKINGVIVWEPFSDSRDEYMQISSLHYSGVYKSALDYIKDINVFMPDSLLAEYYIATLGYYSNRFYISIRDYNSHELYYACTQEFVKPASGVKTYGLIFDNDTFCYANITVDWSKYSDGDLLRDATGTTFRSKVHIIPYSLSEMKMIVGENLWINGNRHIELSDINIIGDNVSISIEAITTRISLVKNASLEGINFIYNGNDAITTRTPMEDEAGNQRLVPIISQTNMSSGNIGVSINPSDAFINIEQYSGQCSIRNCTFSQFPNLVIYNFANGRHLSGDHANIENNVFVYDKLCVLQREEFGRLAHNVYQGCGICIYCYVSNINITDNKFLRCDAGLYFNTEEAYGFADSCTFVHCGVASIFARLINSVLGFVVRNAFIVQAPVICLEANALSITDSILDTYFIISSGHKNRIAMNMMRKVYAGYDGITNIFNVPQDTLIELNRAINANENDSIYNL